MTEHKWAADIYETKKNWAKAYLQGYFFWWDAKHTTVFFW